MAKIDVFEVAPRKGNPPAILADEPTGNLDLAMGNGVMKLLTEL